MDFWPDLADSCPAPVFQDMLQVFLMEILHGGKKPPSRFPSPFVISSRTFYICFCPARQGEPLRPHDRAHLLERFVIHRKVQPLSRDATSGRTSRPHGLECFPVWDSTPDLKNRPRPIGTSIKPVFATGAFRDSPGSKPVGAAPDDVPCGSLRPVQPAAACLVDLGCKAVTDVRKPARLIVVP
jgi:hypothetical protein